MDMEAKEGSPIQLTIGIPKDLPSMPDLSGMSFDEASAKLQEMGVDKDNILPSEKFDESEPGTVLEQFPEADAKFDPAAEDTKITLTVSKGEEAFEMPNLIGKTEAEAKAIILKNDLKLPEDKIMRESSYSQPKGKVFKQFPEEPNEMVTPKTEVMIWVSSGYPADSREQKLSVTVSPAVEGQTSKIRIVYSDATGDNIEWGTKEITATTSIPITLILSPNKDGQISIYRDGQFLQKEPVPYQVIPASNTPVTDPDDPGDGTDTGEVPADGDGTNPDGDDANPE
jgi:serine/threonine-protein kinase